MQSRADYQEASTKRAPTGTTFWGIPPRSLSQLPLGKEYVSPWKLAGNLPGACGMGEGLRLGLDYFLSSINLG